MSVVERAGFVGRLQSAAYASQYFNYRYALDARLREEDASGEWREAIVLEQEAVTAREHTQTVELPSLDDVDELQVDVALHCKEGPADCSEWDRIAYINVCSDETCDDTKRARPLDHAVLASWTPAMGRWMRRAYCPCFPKAPTISL